MKVLKKSFENLNNVKIITNFSYDNRLFQVADMLTLVDKIIYKMENNMKLSTSESLFFTNKELRKLIKIRNKKNHSR